MCVVWCCLLCGDSCLPFVFSCYLLVACRLDLVFLKKCVVCCACAWMRVVCCSMIVVVCLLFVVCWLLVVKVLLCVVCCALYVVRCFVALCCLVFCLLVYAD